MPEENKTNRTTAQQQGMDTVVVEDSEFIAAGFTQVPNAVLKRRDLSFGARLTYATLLSYAWQKDNCFAGQEALARDLGVTRRAIINYINELKGKNLVVVKRRGLGQTNIYYIKTNFEADVKERSHPEVNAGSDQEMNAGSHKEYEESKNTKSNKTKSFRKATAFTTETGGEGTQAPAQSHIAPMTTGKQTDEGTNKTTCVSGSPQKQTSTQKPVVKNEAPKHTKPVYIGKPITQEEIDEKRRRGQNASGYTPLSHIPPSHWQELEARAATHPTNGNGNGHHAGAHNGNGLHYSSSTTYAPDFIDALIEQFSKLLHDEAANIPQNINRAAKLYRQSGASEEVFITLLHDAYTASKRKQKIATLHSDGRPNKMPYFFSVLADKLGVKPNQPT